jgi:hypothetical protein
MLIDCADCVMRDVACGDCVVTFLIGPPDRTFEPVEQAALAVLADGGLIPPLRMVPGTPDAAAGSARGGPALGRSGRPDRERGHEAGEARAHGSASA